MKNWKSLFAVLAICTGFAASQAGAAVLVPSVVKTSHNEVSRSISPSEVKLLGTHLDESYRYGSESQKNNTVALRAKMFDEIEALNDQIEKLKRQLARQQDRTSSKSSRSSVPTVPFFSQFADIASPQWQKVGCGIASVAMLIDYYNPGEANVETLLQQGRNAGYFLSDAGWIHAGLINLSKPFGLTGESKSLAGVSRDEAFAVLTEVLKEGPVMASVHYTFEPTNPIPHLVVVNGVKNGQVYYNDPAEKSGGGNISIAQFQRAWKQRYIEIRPVS